MFGNSPYVIIEGKKNKYKDDHHSRSTALIVRTCTDSITTHINRRAPRKGKD